MEQSIPQTQPQQSSAKPQLISLGDLLYQSFSLYQKLFWISIKLASVKVAIIFGCILSLVLTLSLLLPSFVVIESLSLLVLTSLVLAVVGIAIALVGIWVDVSLLLVLKEKEVVMTTKQALAKGWALVWTYAWISILQGLITGLGLLLLIVPGIIFAVRFVFSGYILVFEGIKGIKALKRSKELVRGYWWPVLGRVLLVSILSLLVSRLPFIGFILAILFAAPFVMVYTYLIYEDLRRIHSVSM